MLDAFKAADSNSRFNRIFERLLKQADLCPRRRKGRRELVVQEKTDVKAWRYRTVAFGQGKTCS